MNSVNLNYDPWQYLTVENFLSPERWEEIQDLARSEMEAYHNSKDLTISGKYIRYVGEDLLPESNVLYKEMERFREPPKNVKKVLHWAVCPPNYTMPRHCDYPARFFTAVFYINPLESYGTILCENKTEYKEYKYPDCLKQILLNDNEIEVPWKPNKVFAFNNLPKAWHYYKAGDEPRICIQSFFCDVDLILTGGSSKAELDYLIDVDPKYYD